MTKSQLDSLLNYIDARILAHVGTYHSIKADVVLERIVDSALSDVEYEFLNERKTMSDLVQFTKNSGYAIHLCDGEKRDIFVMTVSGKYAMVRRPYAMPYIAHIAELYERKYDEQRQD